MAPRLISKAGPARRAPPTRLENGGVWLTFMALAGGGCALVSLLGGLLAVRARWLPRWSTLIPAGLVAATIVAYAATAAG